MDLRYKKYVGKTTFFFAIFLHKIIPFAIYRFNNLFNIFKKRKKGRIYNVESCLCTAELRLPTCRTCRMPHKLQPSPHPPFRGQYTGRPVPPSSAHMSLRMRLEPGSELEPELRSRQTTKYPLQPR